MSHVTDGVGWHRPLDPFSFPPVFITSNAQNDRNHRPVFNASSILKHHKPSQLCLPDKLEARDPPSSSHRGPDSSFPASSSPPLRSGPRPCLPMPPPSPQGPGGHLGGGGAPGGAGGRPRRTPGGPLRPHGAPNSPTAGRLRPLLFLLIGFPIFLSKFVYLVLFCNAHINFEEPSRTMFYFSLLTLFTLIFESPPRSCGSVWGLAQQPVALRLRSRTSHRPPLETGILQRLDKGWGWQPAPFFVHAPFPPAGRRNPPPPPRGRGITTKRSLPSLPVDPSSIDPNPTHGDTNRTTGSTRRRRWNGTGVRLRVSYHFLSTKFSGALFRMLILFPMCF